MQYDKVYTVTESRLNRSYLYGFEREKEGALSLKKQGKDGIHVLILPVFLSSEKESAWGIFHLKAVLPGGCRLIVRAFARDADTPKEAKIREMDLFFQNEFTPLQEKIEVFENAGGINSIGHEDILLYGLRGQFLWICIEVTGEGEGSLSHMLLEKTGDNFMQTFPEIYQEPAGFFHRYMSVFSTVYHSVNDELDTLRDSISIDKAPERMLPYFAEWLGLTWEGGYPDAKILRKLLKEIYRLNKIKGTKRAIARLVEIVLDKPAIIIERNRVERYLAKEDKKVFNRLYGSSMWDVTILVNAVADERQRAQLDELIRQFKPVRSRVKLVFCTNCSRMDSYCYLDENAVLSKQGAGWMDEGAAMDGSVFLT